MLSVQPFSAWRLYNEIQTPSFFEKHTLVDLRTAVDFADAHISGAINLTLESMKSCEKFTETKSYFILYGQSQALSPLDAHSFPGVPMERMFLLDTDFQTVFDRYPMICSLGPPSLREKKSLCLWEGDKADTGFPSEIVEGFLFLGSHRHAQAVETLRQLKVRWVLNMAAECEVSLPPDFHYLHVNASDYMGSLIQPFFEESLEFIRRAKANGERVLVHCAFGVSRSAAIVLAFLMHELHVPLSTAYDMLRSRRWLIRPNAGFLAQLGDLEVSLFGGKPSIPITLPPVISRIMKKAASPKLSPSIPPHASPDSGASSHSGPAVIEPLSLAI